MAKGPEEAPSSPPGSPTAAAAAGAEEEGGAAKEECAWCKYMKGGGCKDAFEAWQSCVDGVMGEGVDEEARRAAVDNCSNVTQPLFECMMRHRDYYGAQLSGMGGGGDGAPEEPTASRGDGGGAAAAAAGAAGAGTAAPAPS
ncbi:MAG: GCK domain-containing protein [Monoraphidium minutum]|nr:MAG: GCK domain-containing protein [Monoraphidium minutum]